jgi:hypothetical protein
MDSGNNKPAMMPKPFLHSALRPTRRMIAATLTAIYLVIAFSPLTPFAMQSKPAAHAVTGECSGDCRIDGCSLERSATHTCCCRQKKHRPDSETHHHSNADQGGTQPAPMADTRKPVSSTCEHHLHDTHENGVESESVSKHTAQEKRTTTVSISPCGSGKLFTLLNVETTHHLPFFFIGEIPSAAQSIITVTAPDRLISRFGDPPDPPPRLSHIS